MTAAAITENSLRIIKKKAKQKAKQRQKYIKILSPASPKLVHKDRCSAAASQTERHTNEPDKYSVCSGTEAATTDRHLRILKKKTKQKRKKG